MLIPDTPKALGFKYNTWQPNQKEAIEFALEGFTTHNLIALDMPVGSGKSLVAMAIAHLFTQSVISKPGRAVIVTGTKGLQDQYTLDYTGSGMNMVSIKGANNYSCSALNDRAFDISIVNTFYHDRRFKATADQGPCYAGIFCSRKIPDKYGFIACEYFAKQRAIKMARIGITNYAMWFTGALLKADLLICDEAHLLMQQIDNFAKIGHPDMPMGTLAASKRWAVDKLRELEGYTEKNIAQLREIDSLNKLLQITDEKAWVVSGSDGDRGWYPIKCTNEGTTLATSATKILLLSGTITESDIKEFQSIAPGIDLNYKYFSVPSTFPVKNRPIILSPAYAFGHPITLNYNSTDAQVAAVNKHIIKIVRLSEPWDNKGIIHTTSYARAKAIVNDLTRAGFGAYIYFPRFGRDLSKTITKFKLSTKGGILVSPSITTGFDFPGDLCVWQIIVKIPYPNVADNLVKARMELDPLYLARQAAKTLMQTSGRGNRLATDKCTTWVVDNGIQNIIRYKQLFSKWFLEALKYE
jgi:Rad3-related DNA helicase